MCGRFASFTDAQDLADELAIAELAEDARLLGPSWNVAPTDPVRIVVERRTGESGAVTRSMRVARWGLVPSWAKDPGIGARMINARGETLLDKSAFARPLAVRRCLVVADGYFEWRTLSNPGSAPGGASTSADGDPDTRRRGPGRSKQAYWIHPRAGGVTAFAGLFEFWRDRSLPGDHPGHWLVSTTVITRASTGPMERLHDRTPAILAPRLWDRWLDPGTDAHEASELLQESGVDLTARPVLPAVGSVRNDGPGLIEPDPDPRDPEPVAL